MELRSDDPSHGFQFPGTFELSAMGAAEKDLETVLPSLLLDAGIEVLHESVTWKHSSNGRFVSVRIQFRAGRIRAFLPTSRNGTRPASLVSGRN